ncbi:MAG: carboxypeptidase regulatory-like domain-containing protein [Planctomycetaceae bacterium]|nr:carboxypeptidase regulatory-like domain-containing protein [Planctomycetaceae bacterium]
MTWFRMPGRALPVLLISMAFVSGCGRSGLPELADVSGTIRLDNKPVPNASVVFIPQNGRPSSGVTDSDGHYSLMYNDDVAGVVLGTCRVLISTGTAPNEDSDGNTSPGNPETIPMEYNVQSTLSFEVRNGDNTADFSLTSGGSVIRSDNGEDSPPENSRNLNDVSE